MTGPRRKPPAVTAISPGAPSRAGRLATKGAQAAAAVPGSPGAADQALPSTHVQLLEVVETQIEDIYQVLDVQVKRFAQIQQQLDELRGKVRQLMEKARISS
jgi:hypothetical protein